MGVSRSSTVAMLKPAPPFRAGNTRDGLVYAAGQFTGVHVVDVSDPTSPGVVGSVDTPGSAQAVAVSVDHAFIADDFSGMQVIDISDCLNPHLVGSVDAIGYATGIAGAIVDVCTRDRDITRSIQLYGNILADSGRWGDILNRYDRYTGIHIAVVICNCQGHVVRSHFRTGKGIG